MGFNLSDQEKNLGNYFCEFPINHCVPIYFGSPADGESSVNNGTATLLKKNNRLYVVTNLHVLQKYFERKSKEERVLLQVGGLHVENVSSRIILDDANIDICIMDFTDHEQKDFSMGGNVPTKFFELGEIQPPINVGAVVAFGGYPGVYRVREKNHLSFHTFSSGASIVHETSDRNIIISIDHAEESITTLNLITPPDNIGGMSGGPVFEISKVGRIATFRFAGIITECNGNLQVMFAKPIALFAHAFS